MKRQFTFKQIYCVLHLWLIVSNLKLLPTFPGCIRQNLLKETLEPISYVSTALNKVLYNRIDLKEFFLFIFQVLMTFIL